MWVQLEFNFEEKPKKKKFNDYESLYRELCKGPMTFGDIQKFLQIESKPLVQVAITTLCLNYAVWSPERGLYKVCEPSDYAASPKDVKEYGDDD